MHGLALDSDFKIFKDLHLMLTVTTSILTFWNMKEASYTLITAISSDLPLSSGDIKWVGFHRPLPSTAVVDNYTTDGVLYSRLSLYELSFEDDSGNYTNIVSNQRGTSFVFEYIKVQS